MFEYNYNSKTKVLDIMLPKVMQFNFGFMNDITDMIKNIEDRECSKIRVSCKEEPSYSKMCKAYIYNVLRELCKTHSILWNRELNDAVTSSVSTTSGSKFTSINLTKVVTADMLNDYKFRQEQDVNKPIEELAKLIVDKNYTIRENAVKEFLTTTIGEIFSNAFLHSARDELSLIYDIELKNDNFYLCVTVLDYGNTIGKNVRDYFKEKGEEIEGEACIAWAIVERNTTRKGSGGYGLPSLIDCIWSTRGELNIFSGDSYYRLKNSEEKIEKSYGFFPGTSVMFRIKLFETENIIAYDEINKKVTGISLANL